jgi:hypothetical protein
MSDNNYALIQDGYVMNVVVWNGEGDIFSEYKAIRLNDHFIAGIGWGYDGTDFSPPVISEQDITS